MAFEPPPGETLPRCTPTERTFPALRKEGDIRDPAVRVLDDRTDLLDVVKLVTPSVSKQCLSARYNASIDSLKTAYNTVAKHLPPQSNLNGPYSDRVVSLIAAARAHLRPALQNHSRRCPSGGTGRTTRARQKAQSGRRALTRATQDCKHLQRRCFLSGISTTSRQRHANRLTSHTRPRGNACSYPHVSMHAACHAHRPVRGTRPLSTPTGHARRTHPRRTSAIHVRGPSVFCRAILRPASFACCLSIKPHRRRTRPLEKQESPNG
jgi:hypothetical protein